MTITFDTLKRYTATERPCGRCDATGATPWGACFSCAGVGSRSTGGSTYIRAGFVAATLTDDDGRVWDVHCSSGLRGGGYRFKLARRLKGCGPHVADIASPWTAPVPSKNALVLAAAERAARRALDGEGGDWCDCGDSRCGRCAAIYS